MRGDLVYGLSDKVTDILLCHGPQTHAVNASVNSTCIF